MVYLFLELFLFIEGNMSEMEILNVNTKNNGTINKFKCIHNFLIMIIQKVKEFYEFISLFLCIF